MTNDKMGAEDGTVIDADAPSSESGAGFISRRVTSDPLRLPYSRIAREVTEEIFLATYEQRKDLPKTATPIEEYDERNGRAATPDPAAVRERIQGLLLRGLLTAFIRGPSGRIFSVSLHAFAHDSEIVFKAMEQGRKITVSAMPENLIVDFVPTTDTHNPSPDADGDNSGMVTGTVFFREDNFRTACAADPVEIDYSEPVPLHTMPEAAAPEVAAPPAEPSPETHPRNANAAPADEIVQNAEPAQEKSKRGNKFLNEDIFDLIDPVLNGDHGGLPKSFPDYCRKLLSAHGDKFSYRNLSMGPYAEVRRRYDEWARVGGHKRRQQKVNGRLVEVE